MGAVHILVSGAVPRTPFLGNLSCYPTISMCEMTFLLLLLLVRSKRLIQGRATRLISFPPFIFLPF